MNKNDGQENMSKIRVKRELPKMYKYELFLAGFKSYTMAQLVAHRLHNYFNEPNLKASFEQKEIHFITMSDNNNMKLFIGCDEPISSALEAVATSMAFRFEKDLEPYFEKLVK